MQQHLYKYNIELHSHETHDWLLCFLLNITNNKLMFSMFYNFPYTYC